MRLIDVVDQEFESSSMETEQYRLAKRRFRNILKTMFGKHSIHIGSCPHFEITGFISRNDKLVYFSTGNLRFGQNMECLVRTAEHLRDWTGGMNNFVRYTNEFDQDFKSLVEKLTE